MNLGTFLRNEACVSSWMVLIVLCGLCLRYMRFFLVVFSWSGISQIISIQLSLFRALMRHNLFDRIFDMSVESRFGDLRKKIPKSYDEFVDLSSKWSVCFNSVGTGRYERFQKKQNHLYLRWVRLFLIVTVLIGNIEDYTKSNSAYQNIDDSKFGRYDIRWSCRNKIWWS